MSDKRKAAELLYFQGWTGQRIAKTLDLRAETITRYKTQGDWANRRNEYLFNQETSDRNIWELIRHQTEALRKMKDMMSDKLENATSPKEIRDTMMISSGEIDSLRKLVASISKKDMRIKDYLDFVNEFTSWAASEDVDAAKVIAEFADQFIKTKLTLLSE